MQCGSGKDVKGSGLGVLQDTVRMGTCWLALSNTLKHQGGDRQTVPTGRRYSVFSMQNVPG